MCLIQVGLLENWLLNILKVCKINPLDIYSHELSDFFDVASGGLEWNIYETMVRSSWLRATQQTIFFFVSLYSHNTTGKGNSCCVSRNANPVSPITFYCCSRLCTRYSSGVEERLMGMSIVGKSAWSIRYKEMIRKIRKGINKNVNRHTAYGIIDEKERIITMTNL